MTEDTVKHINDKGNLQIKTCEKWNINFMLLKSKKIKTNVDEEIFLNMMVEKLHEKNKDEYRNKIQNYRSGHKYDMPIISETTNRFFDSIYKLYNLLTRIIKN